MNNACAHEKNVPFLFIIDERRSMYEIHFFFIYIKIDRYLKSFRDIKL